MQRMNDPGRCRVADAGAGGRHGEGVLGGGERETSPRLGIRNPARRVRVSGVGASGGACHRSNFERAAPRVRHA